MENNSITSAVDIIKTAILHSQALAIKAVNQEQLALYYGIGRFLSANTRNKNWGTGAIRQLRLANLPQFPRFKVAYLAQLSSYLRIINDEERRENEAAPIGIILCKNADKAYVEYIMQDFRQPMGVATYKTSNEMDPELLKVLPPKEELQKILENKNDNRQI